MAHDISPNRYNVAGLFNGTSYFIDFYQREYKWGSEQVTTLLDDVFHKFRLGYEERSERDVNQQTIDEFPWYYLNTLITNSIDGQTYIVDGQQRMTTITLVLIKLYHMLKSSSSDRADWVKRRILDYSPDGDLTFWMGQGKRADPLESIFKDETGEFAEVTAKQMVKNYGVISAYLDGELDTQHKLEMFTLYFLLRLVLVNLAVEQTDVPMVFEVINDRGIGLMSHEILKGKLLSRIDKAEVAEFAQIWETNVNPLDSDDKADLFFQTFFKARLPIERRHASAFDRGYQRAIFESQHNLVLGLKDSARRVKEFIRNELVYFIELFKRIHRHASELSGERHESVRFNGLTGMDQQVLLMLAACELNDSSEEDKIVAVARELDRFYVLLQLNKAYDSQRFTDLVYDIRDDIGQAAPSEYREIFDRRLIEQIRDKRKADVDSPFVYRHFKQVGYEDLNTRFLRYFFARVEYFVAKEIKKQTQSSFYEMVRSDRRNSDFHHVEHVLAHNEENLELFENEEEFERERNRLGALLLLRGKENQSSGNETYDKKRLTYSGSLFWNQTLCDSFYSSKPDHLAFIRRHNLDLQPIEVFDIDAVEKRTQQLFEVVKIIWK